MSFSQGRLTHNVPLDLFSTLQRFPPLLLLGSAVGHEDLAIGSPSFLLWVPLRSFGSALLPPCRICTMYRPLHLHLFGYASALPTPPLQSFGCSLVGCLRDSAVSSPPRPPRFPYLSPHPLPYKYKSTHTGPTYLDLFGYASALPIPPLESFGCSFVGCLQESAVFSPPRPPRLPCLSPQQALV